MPEFVKKAYMPLLNLLGKRERTDNTRHNVKTKETRERRKNTTDYYTAEDTTSHTVSCSSLYLSSQSSLYPESRSTKQEDESVDLCGDVRDDLESQSDRDCSG